MAPNTWDSGSSSIYRWRRMEPGAKMPLYAPRSRAPWESTAPLGRPEVPPVRKMAAGVSLRTGAKSASAGARVPVPYTGQGTPAVSAPSAASRQATSYRCTIPASAAPPREAGSIMTVKPADGMARNSSMALRSLGASTAMCAPGARPSVFSQATRRFTRETSCA